MYLYSALFVVPHTQGTQAWITQCYLQLHQCLPLPRKRSPDGASPDWGCAYLIVAYYSFTYPERMKGWVGLVGWPAADVYPHKWSPISCRSSAGQEKFAGQRPTFYKLCHAINRIHSAKIINRVEDLALILLISVFCLSNLLSKSIVFLDFLLTHHRSMRYSFTLLLAKNRH